ncbi:hypothetical protein [Megasphaera elsdenii]|uniref:hypothetical protein n=1 Tax=Megasphaera elsdenii TaxID=907 RepID=UPI001E4705BB|nr:hypothetical protein [Megasphaera elsdenii]
METLSTKGSISIKNKYSNELLPIVMVIADYIAIWLAEYASYGLRDFLVPETHFHLSWLSIHVIIPVVYIFFYNYIIFIHGVCSSGRSFPAFLNPSFMLLLY